jgi:hypothetical protein
MSKPILSADLAGVSVAYTYHAGCSASQDHYTGNYSPAETPSVEISHVEVAGQNIMPFLEEYGDDDFFSRIAQDILKTPHN